MPRTTDASALTRAYEGLKALMRSGDLPARARIDIEKAALELAVSTMPIRQALALLVAERLVRVSPQSGYEVTLATGTELAELYEWRGALLALTLPTSASAQELKRVSRLAPYTLAVESVMDLLAAAANPELRRAARSADERLYAARAVEAEVLGDVAVEFETLVAALGERAKRSNVLLKSYHRRRIDNASALRERVALKALASNGAPG